MADTKISALTSYTTPLDADVLPIVDTAATATKKVSWANIKATLKAYFDTLYQPLAAALTSWAAITRASGFDTFATTPSSVNLKSLVTDETGSGALVFGTSPAITTPTGIVKGDVGLGNVDNTSDATKNAAVATLSSKTIQFTVEPSTDDTAFGDTISGLLAGDTIAQWDLLYGDSSGGRLEFADADAAATAGGVPLFLATAAGTDGNALTVLKRGIVRNDGWTWSGAFKPLYVSTSPGAMTETAPSGTDDVVRIVGYTLSDDCIWFDPSPDWITRT